MLVKKEKMLVMYRRSVPKMGLGGVCERVSGSSVNAFLMDLVTGPGLQSAVKCLLVCPPTPPASPVLLTGAVY